MNADKVRLAQCLANLLINAAKFTAPGGEIRVSLHTQDDNVIVDVSDNGVGISAEFVPRVFDLFTQGDRSLAGSSSGGLGIGLSICKKLVDLLLPHARSLRARSESMPGSNGAALAGESRLSQPEFAVSLNGADRITRRSGAGSLPCASDPT